MTPTKTTFVPRYAVYSPDISNHSAYAVAHPETQEIISQATHPSKHASAPLTWELEDAFAIAQGLQHKFGHSWKLVLAPGPCPQCGRQVLADDDDVWYPINRDRQEWRAGCNEHDFGCGYEAIGASNREVLAHWNGVDAPVYPTEDIAKEEPAELPRSSSYVVPVLLPKPLLYTMAKTSNANHITLRDIVVVHLAAGFDDFDIRSLRESAAKLLGACAESMSKSQGADASYWLFKEQKSWHSANVTNLLVGAEKGLVVRLRLAAKAHGLPVPEFCGLMVANGFAVA
jgi:hypothetical protein